MADGGQSGSTWWVRNIVDLLWDVQWMLALWRDTGLLKKKEEAVLAKTLDGEIGELVRQKMDYENQLQRLRDKYYGKWIGRTIGAAIGRRIGLAKKEDHRQNIERLERLITELEALIRKAIAVDQKMTAEDDLMRQETVENARAERARANAADRRTGEKHTHEMEQAALDLKRKKEETRLKELIEAREEQIRDLEHTRKLAKLRASHADPDYMSAEELQAAIAVAKAKVELAEDNKKLSELTATPPVDPLDAQKKAIEKAKVDQELKKEEIALLELQQKEAELKKPAGTDPHADVKRQTEEAKLKADLLEAEMRQLEAEKRKKELTTPATPDPHKALREEIEQADLEIKKAELEARKKHVQWLAQPKRELGPAEISAINRQISLLENQIRGLQQERGNITKNIHYLKDQASIDRVRAIDREIKILIKQIDTKTKELSGNL